jgi:hypothetical protein
MLLGSAAASRASDDEQQWRHAMRENLRPGEPFPNIELPNQDDVATKLSDLMGGFPIIVAFSRGYY